MIIFNEEKDSLANTLIERADGDLTMLQQHITYYRSIVLKGVTYIPFYGVKPTHTLSILKAEFERLTVLAGGDK